MPTVHVPLPSLQRLIAGASLTLKIILVTWMLLAFAAVFLMTLGTDEAWVLNGLRSLLRPYVPNLSTELNVTNGGPFALANLGTEAVLGGRLWAHRLISVVAMAGSFALVLRRGQVPGSTSTTIWLGMSVLLCVPGIAEVGSAALGTSVGLFLMLASMLVWTSPAGHTWKRVVFGGLLYGLAAASRFDLVLFGAAVLLASNIRLTASNSLEVKLRIPSFLFFGIGLFVFLAHLWIMSLPDNTMAPHLTRAATGISGWSLNYPKLLNQGQILGNFAPPALLAAFAISSIWVSNPVRSRESWGGNASFELLLVVTGLILLAGWLIRAPIPHLRYAIPALFCFASAGALALQRLALSQWAAGNQQKYLLCQIFCVACALGGVASLTRSVILSDSDYVSWEWSGEMAHDYFRRFEAQSDQRQVAEYIRNNIDPSARLYSTLPYVLRYLTERPIVDILQLGDETAVQQVKYAKRVLILTPAVGTYMYLRPDSVAWLQKNSRMTTQIGRFSVYELTSGTDADMAHLVIDRSNYRGHPNSRPWFGRR